MGNINFAFSGKRAVLPRHRVEFGLSAVVAQSISLRLLSIVLGNLGNRIAPYRFGATAYVVSNYSTTATYGFQVYGRVVVF